MDLDTLLAIRRHSATLAQDAMAMRQKLDPQLQGYPAYHAALDGLGKALDALQHLHRQLEAGGEGNASGEFGDLVDGELVGNRPPIPSPSSAPHSAV